MVQWLRLHGFHCRGHGFDPWSGKFHMTQGVARKKKRKEKKAIILAMVKRYFKKKTE